MSTEQKKRGRGRPRKEGTLEDTRKRRAKNMRLRDRVKFTMELWAPLVANGSETGFIEQACEHLADALAKKHALAWRDLWHPHEGVRWLRLYVAWDEYPFTDDHEARRAFVMMHRQFFFIESGDRFVVNVPFVEVLCGEMPDDATRWKKLDRFRALEKEGKLEPGKAMARELAARGLTPPAWPPVPS